MNNGFYLRLAAVNLRKNGRTILPYLIACTATIAMFFTISSLSQNSGLEQMTGSETVSLVLGLGTTVTGIFSAIFLFYTNSFLLKRRKKEFGLYNILGMEKQPFVPRYTVGNPANGPDQPDSRSVSRPAAQQANVPPAAQPVRLRCSPGL